MSVVRRMTIRCDGLNGKHCPDFAESEQFANEATRAAEYAKNEGFKRIKGGKRQYGPDYTDLCPKCYEKYKHQN